MNHRLLASCLGAFIAVMAPTQTFASLTDYSAVVTTGSMITPSSTNSLATGEPGGRWSSGKYNSIHGVNLPFTFYFDGVAYTRISVSTNGVIGLGSSNITTSSSNSLTTTSTIFPRLVPFWDQLQMPGGASFYCSSGATGDLWVGTAGTAPNRTFVVSYENFALGYYTVALVNFQVRLYEGSNRIEFYYGNMSGCAPSCVSWLGCSSSSATIGIARSSSNYISILPSGSSATVSRSSVYNSTNVRTNTITSGVIYRFQPCNIELTGNLAEGGTAAMASGDTLLFGKEVQRGNSQSFTPFSITNPVAGCGTRQYGISITGPNASDFAITNGSGSILAGQTITPALTFTPGAIGIRRATLTISDNNFFTRTYSLVATGLPRINWIPNLADGATPGLANGDTLMSSIIVVRRTYRDLEPITLENFNTNVSAPPAVVTVALDSFGVPSTQYSLQSPASVSLSAGESYAPVIRFNATGVGPQDARLTINADGEVRTFVLRIIGGAPAIAITANDRPAGQEDPVFANVAACVGEGLVTVPFVVRNSGTLPLIVSDIDIYMTDTVVRQGTPPSALLRDMFGLPIPAADYVISEAPGSVPISSVSRVSVPFTIAPGLSRSFYLTYIGQRPGKRYARLYMTTNAENIVGNNSDSVAIEGIVNIDLFGQAVGGQIAADPSGGVLRPVVLPHTRVRDTAYAVFTLANTGGCDLRIARKSLEISSGDVNEFALISALPNTAVDANGDYLMRPGGVDTIAVRFIPTRSGSRTVTMRLQTNDSLLGVDGVTERGSRYLDIQGRGLAGLDTRELVLDPVVIGSSVTGVVSFENSSTGAEQVNQIVIVDGQAAEFAIDSPPTLPTTVLPGSTFDLTVRLTPVGVPGERRTYIILVTNNGDSIAVLVRGEAGTQALSVSPSVLFDNVAIGVGESARGSVVIANNGTLPVRLTSVVITGADSANYRIGILPRIDIDAGASEYLEITFAPTAQGESSAQLDVIANGVTHSVALGGTVLRARGGDPTTGAFEGDGAGNTVVTEMPAGTSSAGWTASVDGLVAMASRPNPASSTTAIQFALGLASGVRIDVVDARGELVRTLLDEPRGAGDHSITVDLTSMPEGAYHVILTAGRARLTQRLVVVR